LVEKVLHCAVPLLVGQDAYGIVIGTFDIHTPDVWNLTEHAFDRVVRQEYVVRPEHALRCPQDERWTGYFGVEADHISFLQIEEFLVDLSARNSGPDSTVNFLHIITEVGVQVR
jgi:hypothetical protein